MLGVIDPKTISNQQNEGFGKFPENPNDNNLNAP
jgi:hypothetical protein